MTVRDPHIDQLMADGTGEYVIKRLRRALLDQGPRPDIHREQLDRLRREWPTLYHAVMNCLYQPERARLGQP